MDIKLEIEKFIVDSLLVSSGDTRIDHDKSLISNGTLDSLALLHLVEFLDERFGVKVEDDELLPENFQTINNIAEFVQKKLQG